MQIDMEIFAPKNNQGIAITIQKKTNSRSIQPTSNKNQKHINNSAQKASAELNSPAILLNVADAIDHKQHSDPGLGLLVS